MSQTTAPTIQQFGFSINLVKAILWQYGTTGQPNLQGLIEAKQAWYDENQTDFWVSWITDVFDLRTCNAFGCNVWAIILGINEGLLQPPITNTLQPWGFDAFNLTNFDGQSNFSGDVVTPIVFTLEEQRLILQLQYRKMIARTPIPETNKILQQLVRPVFGNCWMVDNLNMSITLMCEFVISPQAQVILQTLDILPRAGGVALTLQQVS